MTWRSRIRSCLAHCVGAVIVVALAGALFWIAGKQAERAGDPSPATVLDEAMSKAARQRELTP